MALLDVSLEVLSDPMLTDSFSVKRRAESIGTNGRSSVIVTYFLGIIGVVTMAGGKDLERLPEDQRFDRVISVVTSFGLQGEVKNKQPDLILWRGDQYVVRAIDYYPQFGSGFVQAICSSLDLVDQALGTGRLDFDDPQQSSYIGVLSCY